MSSTHTHTRIKVSSLKKAKQIVKDNPKYSSVAHMIEVLVDKEAKK